MKQAVLISALCIAVAAASSTATVLYLQKDRGAGASNLDARWEHVDRKHTASLTAAVPLAAAAPLPIPVLDATASAMSPDEHQALFAGLASKLVDPASAQLRKLNRPKKDGPLVCGEINSKNRMGGYVGFVPFMAVMVNSKAEIMLNKREAYDAAPDEVLRIMASAGCVPA